MRPATLGGSSQGLESRNNPWDLAADSSWLPICGDRNRGSRKACEDRHIDSLGRYQTNNVNAHPGLGQCQKGTQMYALLG